MNELSPALLAPYLLRGNAPAEGTGASGSIGHVAQEFEAQFIYQLLRQMRASMSLDGDESGGFGAETLGATIDVELARQLSKQGGMGLASLIARAVDRNGAMVRGFEGARVGPVAFEPLNPQTVAPSNSTLAPSHPRTPRALRPRAHYVRVWLAK